MQRLFCVSFLAATCSLRFHLAHGDAQIDSSAYELVFQSHRPVFDKIVREIRGQVHGKGSPRQVLDLGSGPGEPSLTLMRNTGDETRVRVTDFQPSMVATARKRFEDLHAQSPELRVMERASFHQMSAEDLSSIGDGEMDAIVANYIMQFVPDRRRAFAEIARALRPKLGRAYVSVFKAMPPYDMTFAAVKEVAGVDEMDDLEIDPTNMRGTDDVQTLAEGAAMQVDKVHTVRYSFKLGSPKQAADALMFMAGPRLAKLEETKPGATSRFYTVFERMLNEEGFVRDGEVIIPNVIAEISVLKRASDKRNRSTEF